MWELMIKLAKWLIIAGGLATAIGTAITEEVEPNEMYITGDVVTESYFNEN